MIYRTATPHRRRLAIWGLAGLFAFSAGLTGLSPRPSAAATVRALDLGQLMALSESAVFAQVLDVKSVMQESPWRARTEVSLRVDDLIWGQKQPAQLRLSLPGGVADEGLPTERRMTVPGMPQFEAGQRVVLFLERTAQGELVICGLGQGRWLVQADPTSGEWIAQRDLDELNLVGASRKPDAYFASAPPSLDRLPLAQLRGLILQGAEPVAPVRVVRPKTLQLTIPEVP